MRVELQNLKAKKVELVKRASEDRKKDLIFRKKVDKDMKMLNKTDRRQKVEIEKLKRQEERVKNVLARRNADYKLAQNKLKTLMHKKSQRQAEHVRSGKLHDIHSLKEKLQTDLEARMWTKIAKDNIDTIKQERARLFNQKANAESDKVSILYSLTLIMLIGY